MPNPKSTITSASMGDGTAIPEATESNGLRCVPFMAGDGRILYRYESPGMPTVVLPKRLEELTDQEVYDSGISLYDNAPNRLPENLVVEGKDPQWAFHWFNKSAKEGWRVSRALDMGWQPAKKEDLKYYMKRLNDKDGAVEQHDLILMKIPKHILYLQCKVWLDEAKKRGGIENFSNQAQGPLTPQQKEKIDFYVTEQAQNEKQGLGPVVHYAVTPRETGRKPSAQGRR